MKGKDVIIVHNDTRSILECSGREETKRFLRASLIVMTVMAMALAFMLMLSEYKSIMVNALLVFAILLPFISWYLYNKSHEINKIVLIGNELKVVCVDEEYIYNITKIECVRHVRGGILVVCPSPNKKILFYGVCDCNLVDLVKTIRRSVSISQR